MLAFWLFQQGPNIPKLGKQPDEDDFLQPIHSSGSARSSGPARSTHTSGSAGSTSATRTTGSTSAARSTGSARATAAAVIAAAEAENTERYHDDEGEQETHGAGYFAMFWRLQALRCDE